VEAVIWNEDLERAKSRGSGRPNGSAPGDRAADRAAPEWRQGFIAHVRPGGVAPHNALRLLPNREQEGACLCRINAREASQHRVARSLRLSHPPGGDRAISGHPLLSPEGFHPVCTTEHWATWRASNPSSTSEHQIHRLERGLGGGPQEVVPTTSRRPRAPHPTTDDRRSDFKWPRLYDMLPASVPRATRRRAPRRTRTVRAVFVHCPLTRKIKLILMYPMRPGATSTSCCACWIPSAHGKHKWPPPELEAGAGRHHRRIRQRRGCEEAFPQGWKAPKPYLRITQQPK